MALITKLRCPCGIEYWVYIPKKVLYRELCGGRVELGKKIDEYEQGKGEIALAGEAAELRGFQFRDISINEIIQCECGEVFDMLKAIHLDIEFPGMGVLNYEEVRVSQYEV